MPNTQSNRPKNRPQKLRLPFEKRPTDIGEWSYDHRAGLCVTLIAALCLAIAFVAAKIPFGSQSHLEGIEIDMRTLEELAKQKEELEREIKQKEQDNVDWDKINNLVSNENAEEQRAEEQRAISGASDLQQSIADNRNAYEQGLAEESAMLEKMRQDAASKDQPKGDRSDVKIKSSVTVSFSLQNPVRNSRHLPAPSYMCEGGGQVVVAIVVDRGGDVVSARVESGGDECMRSAALSTARVSQFNIDSSAPERHKGTITYIFIPQ